MIRSVCPDDRCLYIEMAESFYRSEAVCHEIPRSHIESAFEEMLRSDVYLEGFMLIYQDEVAGYAHIAKTFSCEGGGLTVWLEEIFVLPKFRSKGLAGELLEFLERRFGEKLARLRLEVTESNGRAAALYKRHGFEQLDYRQMVKDFKTV